MKKYEKYEFCKSIKCPRFDKKLGNCTKYCYTDIKQLHIWLEHNGYEIVKKEKQVVTDKDYTYDTWATTYYKCSDCGGDIKKYSNFCRHCGIELEWELDDEK